MCIDDLSLGQRCDMAYNSAPYDWLTRFCRRLGTEHPESLVIVKHIHHDSLHAWPVTADRHPNALIPLRRTSQDRAHGFRCEWSSQES